VIGEQRDVTFEATDASFAAATCQSYVEVQWWLLVGASWPRFTRSTCYR
jgi:hypothetical protein